MTSVAPPPATSSSGEKLRKGRRGKKRRLEEEVIEGPGVSFKKYLVVLRYCTAQWRYLAAILVLNVATAGLTAVRPWPVKIFVDRVAKQTSDSKIPAFLTDFLRGLSPSQVLLWGVAAFCVLYALNLLLSAALAWYWTIAGRRMVNDLSAALFERLQRL
ncbi:MAG TPA: hypothetical protein VHM24_09920, partial [Gemmatimonadaceae bacterium]|nr:hypothetical protein [Gemmatimonadaceae bacterium]